MYVRGQKNELGKGLNVFLAKNKSQKAQGYIKILFCFREHHHHSLQAMGCRKPSLEEHPSAHTLLRHFPQHHRLSPAAGIGALSKLPRNYFFRRKNPETISSEEKKPETCFVLTSHT